jgi:hypothetical protein
MWPRVHPMSLYANGLRAQHHISRKTTFRTLCAPAHKVRESRPPGSVRGASSNGCPYRDSSRLWREQTRQPGPNPGSLCEYWRPFLRTDRRARSAQSALYWFSIAARWGRTPPVLTRLAKGGRIGVEVMVSAVGWLGTTVERFTRG